MQMRFFSRAQVVFHPGRAPALFSGRLIILCSKIPAAADQQGLALFLVLSCFSFLPCLVFASYSVSLVSCSVHSSPFFPTTHTRRGCAGRRRRRRQYGGFCRCAHFCASQRRLGIAQHSNRQRLCSIRRRRRSRFHGRRAGLRLGSVRILSPALAVLHQPGKRFVLCNKTLVGLAGNSK